MGIRKAPHLKKCKLCENEETPPNIIYRHYFAGWVCSSCKRISVIDRMVSDFSLLDEISFQNISIRKEQEMETVLKYMDNLVNNIKRRVNSNVGMMVEEIHHV